MDNIKNNNHVYCNTPQSHTLMISVLKKLTTRWQFKDMILQPQTRSQFPSP